MDSVKAMEACAQRMRCEELQWMAESVEVNRDAGGNLTEVLAGVAETVRSRARLDRQVQALSAEGRLSARILIAMPIVIIGLQAVFNPSYLKEILHGGGLVLLAAGFVFMVIGYIWTKRIVRIRY